MFKNFYIQKTVQKMKFSTEEIFNGKPHFLCSEIKLYWGLGGQELYIPFVKTVINGCLPVETESAL